MNDRRHEGVPKMVNSSPSVNNLEYSKEPSGWLPLFFKMANKDLTKTQWINLAVLNIIRCSVLSFRPNRSHLLASAEYAPAQAIMHKKFFLPLGILQSLALPFLCLSLGPLHIRSWGKLVIPRAFGSKLVRLFAQGFPSKTRKICPGISKLG